MGKRGLVDRLASDEKARRITEWGITLAGVAAMATVVIAYLTSAVDAPFFR